jgi:hypothetical protein
MKVEMCQSCSTNEVFVHLTIPYNQFMKVAGLSNKSLTTVLIELLEEAVAVDLESANPSFKYLQANTPTTNYFGEGQ